MNNEKLKLTVQQLSMCMYEEGYWNDQDDQEFETIKK